MDGAIQKSILKFIHKLKLTVSSQDHEIMKEANLFSHCLRPDLPQRTS